MAIRFYTDYDALTNLNTPVPAWQTEQEPNFVDPTANRITIVENADTPGTGPYKPTGRTMRVELRPFSATSPNQATPEDGDVQNSSGYHTNRAEVYARHASPGSTPAANWPDPVGSVRWYGFSLQIPVGHVFATDTTWETITQFKGYYGGSPPIAVEIKRNGIILGGTNGYQYGKSGELFWPQLGRWYHLAIGLGLSNDPAFGWVEIYVNGMRVAPRKYMATMGTYNGGADPMYLKQGIYRTYGWADTHVFHYGPMTIGDTYLDVAHPYALQAVANREYWGIRC